MTNKEIYLSLLREHVKRDGLDKLIQYLERSDFFQAPASTRYHNAYPGGLLEHSLYVYNCLKAKMQTPVYQNILTDENVAIVGLLHDIRKTNYYRTELQNKKIGNEWKQVPVYTISDRIPYGGGEKSVMMIETFIKLKAEERYAIRWQTGPYENPRMHNTLDAAIRKFPLILALFEADMEASLLYTKPMPN